MNDDGTVFTEALKAYPKIRVVLSDVMALFNKHVPAAHEDDDFGKRRLRDLLDQLADQKVITLPSSRRLYENHPPVQLPKWIDIARVRQKTVESRTEWHEKLIPMRVHRSEAELVRLRAINAYLVRTRGKSIPSVPVNCRSLHIFGEEKILLSMARGSDVLSDSLSLADLHCFVPYETFLIHDFTDVPAPDRILVIENRQSYHIFKERNRAAPSYRGVILGSGAAIQNEVRALVSLAGKHGIREIVYFGDIDAAGFEIPLTTRRKLGKEAPEITLKPHLELYRQCLSMGSPQTAVYKDGYDAIRKWESIRNDACEWMGDLGLFQQIDGMISKGNRMAQEWVC